MHGINIYSFGFCCVHEELLLPLSCAVQNLLPFLRNARWLNLNGRRDDRRELYMKRNNQFIASFKLLICFENVQLHIYAYSIMAGNGNAVIIRRIE